MSLSDVPYCLEVALQACTHRVNSINELSIDLLSDVEQFVVILSHSLLLTTAVKLENEPGLVGNAVDSIK